MNPSATFNSRLKRLEQRRKAQAYYGTSPLSEWAIRTKLAFAQGTKSDVQRELERMRWFKSSPRNDPNALLPLTKQAHLHIFDHGRDASQIAIKDDESRQEGKLNRKLVVMLKIVVFAPIPSARQQIAVKAKPGLR